MPFEFTGKPPALQGSEKPSTPFAFSGSVGFAAPTANPTFGSFASFGVSSSPWSTIPGPSTALASSTLSANPAFGSSPPPASTEPASTHLEAREEVEVVRAELTALNAAPTDDALMQALRRGISARPAVFGQAAVEADNVLSAFIGLAGTESSGDERRVQLAHVSKSLRDLGSEAPVTKMVRFLLGEVVRRKTPAQPATTPTVPTAMIPKEEDVGDEAREDKADERDRDYDYASTQVFHFAKGSPAYCAMIETVRNAGIISDMLPDNVVQKKALGEKVIDLLAGGKTVGELQVFVDSVLDGKPKRGKREGEGEATAKRLFYHTYLTVVKGNLATDAPPSIDEASKPFRFLDLPPELRLVAYRALLAPTGHISLRSNANNDAYDTSAVLPAHITPNILQTCHLVHKEASAILYAENTICLTVAVAFGCRAMISKEQMPDSVLPLLKSVMLVFDTVHANELVVDDFDHCDWRQLQAMIGLKTARISMIDRDNHMLKDKMEHKASLMEHVIERLPADCTLTYGASHEAEREHVAAIKEGFMKSGRFTHYKMTCYEVDGAALEGVVTSGEVLARKGCKSGCTRDYRYPQEANARGDLGWLKPLVGGGEVDERFVLGR